jgi:hypothetical protein
VREAAGGGVGGEDEIGRASGWAREWITVEFAVVGVS